MGFLWLPFYHRLVEAFLSPRPRELDRLVLSSPSPWHCSILFYKTLLPTRTCLIGWESFQNRHLREIRLPAMKYFFFIKNDNIWGQRKFIWDSGKDQSTGKVKYLFEKIFGNRIGVDSFGSSFAKKIRRWNDFQRVILFGVWRGVFFWNLFFRSFVLGVAQNGGFFRFFRNLMEKKFGRGIERSKVTARFEKFRSYLLWHLFSTFLASFHLRPTKGSNYLSVLAFSDRPNFEATL